MGIIDLIFPKNCLECGESGSYICEKCLRSVRPGWLGRDCLSIFRYEGVIRKAIIALKYKYSLDIAHELADLCVQKLIANHYSLNTVLVPIPLHWYRKNFRGFNQSEEVGKLIAKRIGWEFIPNLLIKNVSTKPQVGLKGILRHQNLKGVFEVNNNSLFVIHNSIMVFDDVYTTGSTLKEAMGALKANGFTNVYGLTIAR